MDGTEFVTGMEASLEEEAPYLDVITEADILTVSDGTNLVIAHTGGTYNLVAGEAELLAGLLYEARQMRVSFLFHFSLKIIQRLHMPHTLSSN